MVIFLDTYAIIEIDKGNPAYSGYSLTPSEVITTILNLVEVHFYYLRNYGPGEAKRIYQRVMALVIDLDEGIINAASWLKLRHRRRLSYADCIGYATSQRFEAQFVTGDYGFKDMKDVVYLR